ncbi:kinase domain-containing protein [Favolaschia claudopus]|uniref:Kinase domain-containing protein n=1 Tax=Favolaschia claudopus TaxID=2862362 RepID=A0AAW0C066_9AGAR
MSDLLELLRQGARTLCPPEIWWASHYHLLLSRGYALRPRYQPGWVPGWETPGNETKAPTLFEDSRMIGGRGHVLDATRVSDGVKVALKMVLQKEEADIHILLGQTLPQNHFSSDNRAVHLLEVIYLNDRAILVFPFLREFESPPFSRIGEVNEALGQFLKGMHYLHEHKIAHRDLGPGNLVMDASRVVPSGWHFSAPWGTEASGYNPIQSVPRYRVSPVEYFIIDFGLSTIFPPGTPLASAQAVGTLGKYRREIPELSETVPYNPFKVDIYQLGHVIMDLVEKYHGLEVYRGLAKRMMANNPDERPWAAECLDLFQRISAKTNPKAPVVERGSRSWVKYAGRQLRILE